MPVLLPGIGQIGIRMHNLANAHTNYITFGLNVGIEPNIEDLSTAVEAFMTDIIQDCSSQITSSEFSVTVDTGSGVGSFTLPYPGGVLTGGFGGEGMTPQVAYVYRKYTGQLGRTGIGRFYLPGVVETKVNGAGVVDATFLEDQRNHAASALNQLATATDTPYEMSLLHATGSDVTVVQALYPEQFVGTQRRRLVRS